MAAMRLPHSEKSSAQPGLFVIFIVLAVIVMTVWYREGESGPVHKLRLGVQAAAAPVSAVGEYATRPVRGLFAWASDLGVSRSQLEALRQQNDELRKTVAGLQEAKLQNERLRGLVSFAQASKAKSLGASVIGRPTDSWEGVITIDRGSTDGVKPGMPVLGPAGLLGQTVDVAPGSSKVRLITDPSSGVAAMLQATRATGIVKGSFEGGLSLEFVSTKVPVRAGDVVITSGIGGVFPKGLIVGEVSKVTKSPADLYQRIELKPSGDLSGLEDVLVLVGITPAVPVGSGE
jgi:rod shape-determining protein MreC